jgi:hypothetical protein
MNEFGTGLVEAAAQMNTPRQRFDDDADISIFGVGTQSSENDRRSFLAIQKFIRGCFPAYTYLEVGSYMGGSLFPYLLDDRCEAAISVDPRLTLAPDERGDAWEYLQNTTQPMIDGLKTAGGPALTDKLTTIESDIFAVAQSQVGNNVRIALIDAEHTNRAAFRDFLKVRSLAAADAVIAFHDANILADALCNIREFLKVSLIHHRAFYLRDQVFLVALGSLIDRSVEFFSPISLDPEEHYRSSKEEIRDMITADFRRQIARQTVAITDLRQHAERLSQQLAEAQAELRRHIELMRAPRPLAKMLIKAIRRKFLRRW